MSKFDADAIYRRRAEQAAAARAARGEASESAPATAPMHTDDVCISRRLDADLIYQRRAEQAAAAFAMARERVSAGEAAAHEQRVFERRRAQAEAARAWT